MLARTCLTLLVCCTSTLAAAKTPARQAEAPKVVTLDSRTAAQPPITRNEPMDMTPPDMKKDWRTEQRWLQAGTGVSWALAGLGTIGFIVPLSMLSRCNAADDRGAMVNCSDERRTAAIMSPILGVLTVAAIIPAAMFTRRLVAHDNKKPVARLRVTPGGLALQF